MIENSNIKSMVIAAGLTGLLLWSVNNSTASHSHTKKKKTTNLNDGHRKRSRKSYKDNDKIARLKSLASRLERAKPKQRGGTRKRARTYLQDNQQMNLFSEHSLNDYML